LHIENPDRDLYRRTEGASPHAPVAHITCASRAHITRHTTSGGYASYRVRLCRTYHGEQSEAYHAPKVPSITSSLFTLTYYFKKEPYPDLE
ncbi:MAG: hypothetical protein IKD45_04000, partial [Clostridia bacterium]|nr:hypothetical protein [Clostridia bacterium]